MLHNLLVDSRLVLVTGKGGTGKTTYAASIGRIKAAKGQRTIVCEIDSQRPAMPSIFGQSTAYEPQEVAPNLSVCNLTWTEALVTYLERSIPMSGIVRKILENEVVNRFLDFTPGSRELAILSRLGQLVEEYDAVVVDMPASGHALSLLVVLKSILQLFRAGPVRDRAQELGQLLEQKTTVIAFVALPEEMVINETLETMEKFKNKDLFGGEPIVLLNRGTIPSLTEDELDVMEYLNTLSLSSEAADFVRAGRWESGLERDTQESIERLADGFGFSPVLIPPRPAGGTQREVVQHVSVSLGRQVGLAKRDLSWT